MPATHEKLEALRAKWRAENAAAEMEAAERARAKGAAMRAAMRAAKRRKAIADRQRRDADCAIAAANATAVDAAPAVDPVAPKPTVPLLNPRPCVRWSLGAPATVEYWMAGWSRLTLLTEYELRNVMTPQLERDKVNLKLWLTRHWKLAPTDYLREWFQRASGDPNHPSYEQVLAELTPPMEVTHGT
jgi:hypothetical protein